MISFKGFNVSGLLDTGTTKTFISRELIRQVLGHQVVQHATADMLQIWLLNGDEVQSQGRVTLEANIEKLQVTFEAHVVIIT